MTNTKCLACDSTSVNHYGGNNIKQCNDCLFQWQIQEGWDGNGKRMQMSWIFQPAVDLGKWTEIPEGCLLVEKREPL